MNFDKSRGPKSGFPKTIPIRRRLRRDMTAAEKLFLSKVGSKQLYNLKFRRQHAIGNYVVDFYCPEKNLIVELDGDTHVEAATMENDASREDYLKSLGYQIVRYNNRDIMYNTTGVFDDLIQRLKL